MSIKAQNLLDQKARKFGASAESIDFQQIILDSINYVLDDIENMSAAASAPRITAIAGTGGTIDLDQQTYQGTISLGMDFYLQDMSQYQIQSLTGVEDRYRRKLAELQTNYYKSIDMNIKFGDSSED